MITKSRSTAAPPSAISDEPPAGLHGLAGDAPSQRRMTLRDSTSINLIAVLAAGGVLGAVLGALSASGLVIGLLVAAVTIVLLTALRRYARAT